MEGDALPSLLPGLGTRKALPPGGDSRGRQDTAGVPATCAVGHRRACGQEPVAGRIQEKIADGREAAGTGEKRPRLCSPGRGGQGPGGHILVGEAGGQVFLSTSPQGTKGTVGKNGAGSFDELQAADSTSGLGRRSLH